MSTFCRISYANNILTSSSQPYEVTHLLKLPPPLSLSLSKTFSTMALKIPHFLLPVIWLSLFWLLFLQGWCNVVSKNNYSDHLSVSRRNLVSRKVLAGKFDFSVFRRHHVPLQPRPSETRIDPLYGVEKRLVPSGPNPLHH